MSRTPPSSPEAERALIGAVLIKPLTFVIARSMFEVDDLAIPVHRDIWEAMRALDDRRVPIDLVSLGDELQARGVLRRLEGGAMYLTRCANDTPTAENVEYYARLVRDKSMLRMMIQACGEVADEAYGDVGVPGEFIRASLGKFSRLAIPASASSETMEQTFERWTHELERSEKGESIARIPTGIDKLDELLGGGMGVGQFIVPCGLTSMGKSSFARQIAFRGAYHRGVPALIFTLEDTRSETFAAGAANLAKIDSYILKPRTPTTVAPPEENRVRWQTIHRAGSMAASLSKLVRIEEHRNIGEIVAVATSWRSGVEGPAVIVVDHTQKVVGNRPKGSNRQEEVWGVARSLKDLAQDLKLPVIAPAQLDNDAAKDKRPPRLGDIRDSKAIEHEADVVIGLHRDRVLDRGKMGLHVLKHRGGRIGKRTVSWEGQWQGFENPTPEMERQIEEDELL